MKIQCAWCGKDLGSKPPYEDESTTHGMCQECLEKEIGSCRIDRFTAKDLELAAEALGIDAGDFPGLLEGMEVEKEHADFTECDPVLTARIVLAHLREDSAYYSKLKEAGL